ncbi:hypothetical protein L484_011706 [Morus notabilis]|uniref:Uncharacterized protein n=1 Tax=Morus notabilis TaxID=981085 RepID=W9RRT1_9ROSA|nr:hypothetical protein L484_011706 [Morus notabilis]
MRNCDVRANPPLQHSFIIQHYCSQRSQPVNYNDRHDCLEYQSVHSYCNALQSYPLDDIAYS